VEQTRPGAGQAAVEQTRPGAGQAAVEQTRPGAGQAAVEQTLPGAGQTAVEQTRPGAGQAAVEQTRPGAGQAAVEETRPGAGQAAVEQTRPGGCTCRLKRHKQKRHPIFFACSVRENVFSAHSACIKFFSARRHFLSLTQHELKIQNGKISAPFFKITTFCQSKS
jgi:hypothetical protein